MKRFWLGIPVCLIGLPLLVCLLMASTPSPVPLNEDPPSAAKTEKLPREDPVEFLENCLNRYQREVKGYRLTMRKQERIGGKLQLPEVIEVAFREKPHSVYMRWIEGARKAERALFVEGENADKMLARPNGFLARKVAGDVVERDVEGADAKQSGRYSLKQFGIKKGTERTVAAWQAAQRQGKLHVDYLGVQTVKEAGDRKCYKLRRSYDAPENDGVMELTIYVDTESWLQVGSILKGEGGKLIGEYFFRDIILNPSFPPGQFDAAILRP